MTRLVGLLVGFAVFFVLNAAYALPTPSVDRRVDAVRTIRWDPPIPIPNLSPLAKFWIAATKGHCLPSHFAWKFYVQRAAALDGLAHSTAFRELIGARDARDDFRSASSSPTDPNPQFRQTYASPGGGPIDVSGGIVTLNLTPDGTKISGLYSYFVPDLTAPLPSISEASAIQSALSHPTAAFLDLDSASTVAPLIVWRVEAQSRIDSSIPRGDNTFYQVTLYKSRAPAFSRVEALVDASSGGPTDFRLLRSDTVLGGDPGGEFDIFVPATNGGILASLFCQTLDGIGPDVNGQQRSFSTSFGLGQPIVLGAPFLPWSMVSCGEGATRGIFYRDVITYSLETFAGLGEVAVFPFRDNDNIWSAPADDPRRHAINSQFWGERILRYFHGLEYENRKSVPVRARFWAAYNDLPTIPTPDPNDEEGHAENAEFLEWGNLILDSNGQIIGDDFEGTGLVVYGGAGATLRTGGDVAILAHEFSHSVTFDHIFFGGNKKAGDMPAIDEGVAEAFSMLILAANVSDLGLGYNTLGEDAPFHLAAGSYFDPANFIKGFPNLEDPENSLTPQGSEFFYWVGQIAPGPSDVVSDRTLIAGPLKLLITGGLNPTLSQSVIVQPGGVNFPSLGLAGAQVNRSVAYQRLGELLMHAIRSGAVQSNATFDAFIDVLATAANQLAPSWGMTDDAGEKVRRAFGAYGFGRLMESEPNDVDTLTAQSDQAAKNVIAAGGGYVRPIKGEICDNDEDFFVLNERAFGQIAVQQDSADRIAFDITTTTPGAKFDVRLYQFEPCSFSEDPVTGSCQHLRRIHPPPDSPIQSPPLQSLPPTPVVFLSSGGVFYRPIFVAVRRHEGTCPSSYTLKVTLTRTTGNEIY